MNRRQIQAVARELVADCVQAATVSGEINEGKIASCLGIDMDDEPSISDDDVIRVEQAMYAIADGIVRRGRLAR